MPHPIVQAMQLSPEQLPALAQVQHDLLVTAGAGSGKTRTLVARYLTFLATGHSLRSTVAITFTRKAAREMRNRVRAQVRHYLEQPDLAPAEYQNWQRVYADLDAARIGTIHSLCAEILHAHPAEAGLDPHFQVLDEVQTALLHTRVVEESMAWAADEADVRALFALLGEGGLSQLLRDLLRRRIDAEAVLADRTSLWPRWEAHLRPWLAAFVDKDDVRGAFDELLSLRESGLLEHARALGDALAEPLQRLLETWEALLRARATEDWMGVATHLATLPQDLKQRGRQENWRPANPKKIIGSLQETYRNTLPGWLPKSNPDLDRQLAQALPIVGRLLDFSSTRYRQLKEQYEALDFDDLESGALALLRSHPAVLAYWQSEVQALLVDEFQDTNARQFELVRLLNGDRGRAFLVGDPKQSIYRFNGADVSLFRDLLHAREAEARAQGDAGCAPLHLQTSYRAHRALLAGLNALMGHVLEGQTDGDLLYHRAEPALGLAAPYIELHLAEGNKSEGALEHAAQALAQRLAELASGGIQVGEGPDQHPLGYGDMAILCRASTSFRAYEDALDRAGIPYLTVAGRGFYQRPEIRDLLGALRALADPTDDLALAGLLRSPAIGLTDAALYTLCCKRTQAHTPLWAALCAGSDDLAAEQAQRARRAVGLIQALHLQAGRTTVADLLATFLEATDYRAALLRAGQGRAARNVSKLLDDALTAVTNAAGGILSVSAFLEYVANLKATTAREGEARATAEGVVQIMSVHAAKGLEFPVVVIGDISHRSPERTEMLLNPELGLLLPLCDDSRPKRRPMLYLLAQENERRCDQQESARLFYVAATRAREKLILSGCLKREGWLGLIADPLGLPQAAEEDGDAVRHYDLAIAQVPISCDIYEPQWSTPPVPQTTANKGTPFSLILPPPLLRPYTGQLQPLSSAEATDGSPPRVWQVLPDTPHTRAPARVIGDLVHAALETWRSPDENYAAWAEAQARNHGLLDPAQLQDAARASRRLLLRFQSTPLFEEIERAEQRLHEVPYSIEKDGQTENGAIDILYRSGSHWTIVEFKTDDLRSESALANVFHTQKYCQQAERYVAAVHRLLGVTPRLLFCLLNFHGRVHVESLEQIQRRPVATGESDV